MGLNKIVDFTTAKLLKEKRYNEQTIDIYQDGEILRLKSTISNKEFMTSRNYSAPTIAEVVMWLYEKHNIYIHISPHGDDETFFQDCKWWFSIYKDTLYNLRGGSKITKGIEDFNSPTEAYESAIEFTLENLI